MNKGLKEKIALLNDEEKYQEIVDIVLATKEEEREFEIISEWGRAENNLGNYEKAIEILISVEDEGKEDSLWNYRMGYAYSGLENYEKAAEYFEKSKNLDPDYAWTYFELGWNLQRIEKMKKHWML